MKNTHLTETRFSNLELSDRILTGLKEAGFKQCTPIQDKALPLSLRGKDVAGQAQTGTGKTAAFLLATFQCLLNEDWQDSPEDEEGDDGIVGWDGLAQMDDREAPVAPLEPTRIRDASDSAKSKHPRAIIIAPTRELAIQIHKDALLLGKFLDFKYALVYGGTDYKKQLEKIKSDIDIIIGTPGRIIDFYKQKAFSLSNIQVTVMDEADRMFDLGFIKDIRYLLRQMPKPEQRLNMLFSATLSYRVTELAYEHMHNPVLIRIETEQVTAKAIRQSAFCPSNEQKIPLLVGLLKEYNPPRSIIFVNTKRCAELLDSTLKANGFMVAALSGDVPQDRRERLLNDFQENRVNLLIATDVAARGLHIADVSHVFNYDLPQDVEDYVHRIGRTARFGASGEAISFVCEQYAYSMPDIEEYIGEKITVQPLLKTLLADVVMPALRPASKNKPFAGNGRMSDGRKPKARPSVP